MAPLVECHPVDRRVAGLISSLDASLGFGLWFNPWSGQVQRAFSLFLLPALSPSIFLSKYILW